MLRRLLFCVVAAELALAGSALTAMSEGGPPDRASASALPRAALTEAALAAAESTSECLLHAVGLPWRNPGGSASSAPRGTSDANPTSRVPDRGSAGKNVSLEWPIDFATGAIPSSAAFNAASGDQLASLNTRYPFSDSVTVGDFNRDGKADVAQTNTIAGSVSVFLGDGDAGFAPPKTYPVGVHPNFVVAGDLDADGQLDLVVANTDSNNLAILRGESDGSFLPAAFVPVPAPRNVAIGNFNGDGLPDLAVASSAPGALAVPSSGGIVILSGTGNAGVPFVAAQTITPTVGVVRMAANYVAVGDFDGDGLDDLAAGVGGSGSAGDRQANDPSPTGDDALIFLNRNAALGAPFETEPQQRLRVGGFPNAIGVADLNGDGQTDLAVLGSSSGEVTTLLGDGHGQFEIKARNVTVATGFGTLSIGDLGDDGIPDVVTANWTSSTVSVLEGTGDGTFLPAVDFWSGGATSSAALGHFDDDGRMDVAVGRLRDDHLALLLNDSPQRGDGVVIERDIPFTGAVDDPLAAHHTLDVYLPPQGTDSFAGKRQRYPVLLAAHGGGGNTGDKSAFSYLMRSLAVQGIVAISTNYRLGPNMETAQIEDLAEAVRWVHDNVGSDAYGGDPDGILLLGHSHGGQLASKLALTEGWQAEQEHLSGVVIISALTPVVPRAEQLRSLLLTGTDGAEIATRANAVAFAAASEAVGAQSEHVTVAGRDHFTMVSGLALANDPGRAALFRFMRAE